jgi:hypothetical protein
MPAQPDRCYNQTGFFIKREEKDFRKDIPTSPEAKGSLARSSSRPWPNPSLAQSWLLRHQFEADTFRFLHNISESEKKQNFFVHNIPNESNSNMSPIIERPITTDAPKEFVCPISLEVMKEPVMSKDGQNYDRQAILQWLNQGNFDCPLTRRPLKPSYLLPNHSLKMSIMRWKVDQGVDLNNNDDDSSESSEYDHGFVGLLNVDGAGAVPWGGNSDPAASTAATEASLRELLELYNEVLELTATPMNSVPQTQVSVNTSVSRSTKRRRLRFPKLFTKKTSV